MLVKLLTSIASSNYSYMYGEVVDFPEADAKRLVASAQAEEIHAEEGVKAVFNNAPQPKAVSTPVPAPAPAPAPEPASGPEPDTMVDRKKKVTKVTV